MAAFPLFDFKLINIGIAVFVLGSIVICYEEGGFLKRFTKRKIIDILILSLPFLLSLIALFWTQNIKSGYTFVERSLPVIIFPLIILLLPPFRTIKTIKNFFQIYIITNVLLASAFIVFSIVSLVSLYENEHLPTISFIKKYRGEFESVLVIGEHPIYLALMIGTAILFLFYFYFKRFWLNLIYGFILTIALFMTASIGPMLALLIAVLLAIILKSIRLKSKLTIIAAFLVIVLSALTLSPFQNRVNEFINTTEIYPSGDYFNSFNTRVGIYNCAIKIGKKVPVIGLGPGDVQEELDLCYKNEYKTKAYENGIFNTHNQYLHYWLSYGIWGLTMMFVTYIIFYKRAISNRDEVYIVFLTFMLICFLFENILSRNTGIMVYSIFNTILYFKS